MQLTINENKYNLVWGMGAFEIVCDKLDLTLLDIEVGILDGNDKILNNLAFASIQNGCEVDEVECKLNYKQFLAWLDAQPAEFGKELIDDFLNSYLSGKTIRSRFEEIVQLVNESDIEEEGKPKKRVKKK